MAIDSFAGSRHNRIVVTKLDGSLIEIIGAGEPGAADGSSSIASFHQPGDGLVGDYLYIADTENHLIRRVDQRNTPLNSHGTGQQSHDLMKTGQARTVDLSSPDLQPLAALYIAMAADIRFGN